LCKKPYVRSARGREQSPGWDGRYSTCTLTHCAVVKSATTHGALNRPSPDEVEADDRCGVMVLTGEETAFLAGMDIKEYFRDMKDQPRIANIKVRRLNREWQWRRLRYYQKPTIAMVNGWCIGGAFLQMVSCDMAIAA